MPDGASTSLSPANIEADRLFAQALCTHVSGSLDAVHEQYLTAAQSYWPLWKLETAFPEPSWQYDARLDAKKAAESAMKSADMAKADIAWRIAIALEFADTSSRLPTERYDENDTIELYELVETLVMAGANDRAKILAQCVMESSDMDVRKALLRSINNRIYNLRYSDPNELADSLAKLGLALIPTNGGELLRYKDDFETQLQTSVNRRALAAVPDELPMPNLALLSAEERAAADTRFISALRQADAGDWADAETEFIAVAKTYAAAWGNVWEIPDLDFAQQKLYLAAYSLIEPAETAGQHTELEVIRRFFLAVRMAENADEREAGLTGDDSYELSRLALTLVRLDKLDDIAPLAKLLAASPDETVRVTLPSILSREARDLQSVGELDRAEALARFGVRQYTDKESLENGLNKNFSQVLDNVLAERPPPDIPESLGLPDPARIATDARREADALYLKALRGRIAGDLDGSQPKFMAAAKIYQTAWPEPIPIPEYRLNQLKLVSAARTAGEEAVDANKLDAADIALRLSSALMLAETADQTFDPNFDTLDATSVERIALLLFKQGRNDAAIEIYEALLNASDPAVVANVASDFTSEAYTLKKNGQLDPAEASAKFGLALFKGKTGKVRNSHARLARMYGEILTQKDQPELAAPWLEIGWNERDQDDSFESQQSAESWVGNLVRLGQIDLARPIIVSQVPGSNGNDIEAAQWVLSLSKSPLNGFTAHDALALRKLALAMIEKKPPKEKYLMLDAIGSLAGGHFDVGEFEQAENLYRRALATSEQEFGLDTNSAGFNIQGLAATLLALGRIDEASALFGRYWQTSQDYDDPDPASFQDTQSQYINILIRQGRLAEADDLSARALTRFSAMATVTSSVLAEFELDRAKVLLGLGRLDEADALARQADARGSTFSSRGLLAVMLEQQGRAAEAEPLRRLMLEQVEKDLFAGPYSEARLAMLSILANNLAMQGRIAEADAIYVDTVKLLGDVFGAQSAQYADQAEDYAQHLLKTGRINRAREVAQSVLTARIATRDRSGASVGDVTRIALAKAESRAAGLFVRSLLLDSSLTAIEQRNLAFDAMQRAETSAAGIAMARSASKEAAQVIGAGDAATTWRDAQARLIDIDDRISKAASIGNAGDTARLAASAERIEAVEAVKRAETALLDRFPRFFDLVSSKPLDLAELQGQQGLLREDEALIILNPGNDSLPDDQQFGSVFVVTRDETAFSALPLDRKQLIAAIERFHRTLDNSGETAAPEFDSPSRFFSREQSFALYQALFGNADIQRLLKDKQRWTLAPQGVFASLPFAALVSQSPTGGQQGDIDPVQLRATHWLGLEKALAITPSVAAIGIQRRYGKTQSPGIRVPFFGLGDPAFKGIADPPLPPETKPTKERGFRAENAPLNDAGAYFRGGTANLQAVNQLSRLSGTSREVRTLADLLNGNEESLALQLTASEAEVRRRNASGDLGRTDVIVFATHGLLANELGGTNVEPALALTPPVSSQDQLTSENDGLLTASEAALLNLSARFVILSACNTAASGKPDAESLSGLARAFFYAGAQSLLVTHYYVYDRAAPLLTGEAIRIVNNEGVSTAEAMRRSMTALVANQDADQDGLSFAHPKAWAPFAVIDAN